MPNPFKNANLAWTTLTFTDKTTKNTETHRNLYDTATGRVVANVSDHDRFGFFNATLINNPSSPYLIGYYLTEVQAEAATMEAIEVAKKLPDPTEDSAPSLLDLIRAAGVGRFGGVDNECRDPNHDHSKGN